MEIRPAEISEILKKQIASFDTDANVAETGQVLSVGDGIAQIFGLQNVMAGELVEFPGAGLKGHGAEPRRRQRRHRHLR
jgi:F-type H+-transporting ATPase subunit alpha